jgi:hypothetical protein
MSLFVYPDVGRAGLGNLLLTWAHAEIFAQRTGAQRIAPYWTRPKIGPLLRGERDLRYYTGLFTRNGAIGGPRRRLLLMTHRRITAEQYAADPDAARTRGDIVVFTFPFGKGLSGLAPHRPFLSDQLNAMLSPRIRRRLAAYPDCPEIAVHVRRGDRPALPFGQPFGDDWLPGLPEEWFIGAIESIREAAGRRVPVTVFSDARPAQIARLLAVEGVHPAPAEPAIVDLLMMSRAGVLVPTGSSTLSLWSSLLGGMPTVHYPGVLERLRPDWGSPLVSDLQGRLDPESCRIVRDALATSPPA